MEKPQGRDTLRLKKKYRAKSLWTPWAIATAVLIAVVAQPTRGGVASGASSKSVASIGSPAPDFTLRLLDGKTVNLSSLKGKPVVVNFWHSG